MKPIILAIVGDSGAGKTTLSWHLSDVLDIPYVVSYTTREMRPGEIDGKDHYFVNVENMPDASQMLAYTKFGNNHYWTTISQIESNFVTSYVIDEDGLRYLQKFFADSYKILAVNVTRAINDVDSERKSRDEGRIAYEGYDCTIANNGSLDEFLENGAKQICDLVIENLE